MTPEDLLNDLLDEGWRRYWQDPVFHARAHLAAQVAGGCKSTAVVALVLAELDPVTGEKADGTGAQKNPDDTPDDPRTKPVPRAATGRYARAGGA